MVAIFCIRLIGGGVWHPSNVEELRHQYCKPLVCIIPQYHALFSYHQAQSSATLGLRKLEDLGVPTQRPEDYYAEMVKTDDHMRRVRQCLLSRQKVLEQKEKARKMRELKKYGKKV